MYDYGGQKNYDTNTTRFTFSRQDSTLLNSSTKHSRFSTVNAKGDFNSL